MTKNRKTQIIFISISIIIILTAGCAAPLRFSPGEMRDFPQDTQEHIKKGEVIVGMTFQQVRLAWGGPMSVNVLAPIEGGKTREEWVYSRLNVFSSRLIFTDGRLTEIISTEPGIVK